MATMHDYLLEQQEFVKGDMAALLENQSDRYFKQRFADSLAKLMVIQHMIEHKNYGDRHYKDETYADSAIQSNMRTLINDRKKLLSDGTLLASRYNKDALINMVTNEKGEVDSPEKIKDRFLKQTGRTDILTEDELRPDHYWRVQTEHEVQSDMEAAFSKEEIDAEDAKRQLATALAARTMRTTPKASQAEVQQALEQRRDMILNGPFFKRAVAHKDGKKIAAMCGKFDPESKKFTAFDDSKLRLNYKNALSARLLKDELSSLKKTLTADTFDLVTARRRLATVLALNIVNSDQKDIRNPPTSNDRWPEVVELRDQFLKARTFQAITNRSRDELAALLGTYDPEKREFKSFTKSSVIDGIYAEEEKFLAQEKAAQEKAEQEKAAREAEEARLREEQEKAAREAEEARLKEEAEKKAAEEARLKEEAEKKAAEEARLKEEAEKKAAEEAKLKEAQEKAAQEQPEQQAEEPVEEQAEEQPKVEEQPKPFDSAEYLDSWQSYIARELKRQLTRDSGYHPAYVVSALTQLRALQEMKESGYVGKSGKQIEDEAEFRASLMKNKEYAIATFGISTSQEDMAKLFGKTEEGVYQLNPVDQVLKTFNESVQQRKREREQNIQHWNKMDSLCTQALNSEGEERRTAVATLVAMQRIYYGEKDANKTNTSLKKISDEQRVENLAKFMLKDKAFQEIADSDRLNPHLENRDLENVAEEVQQFRNARTKEAAQEKARKTDRENVLRAREEAERKNALTDEEVAGLNMTETADKLYSEIVKLGEPLSAAYGNKWMGEVEKAQSYFVDYKGSDGFKKGVEDAQKFLDTKLSDGKTIGQFAKEERLLGANFKKLMDRADEITSPTKTAASWIEEHKAELANRIRGNQRGDNYPAADIARIFAARELSNSVRGKKSTLGESISDYKINKRAAEIMENKSFKDFAAKLSKGENLSKVEAIFKKTHSHGGELDDMFRDYLTKRPAGELENDPKLKRWMPTVKQRVEFLQSEAAKVQKENKTPYKEAAEILLLRQAAEVKRGGKGLEANVPVIGEKGVTSLQASVKNYTNDAKFKTAFDQPDVKKYILSGHGGEMAERYNKQPEAKKIEQKNGQEKGV